MYTTRSTRCRARSTVFWSSMNKDIAEELLSRSVCNSTRPPQQKEPLQPHPFPALPWSTVATDMFEWHGQQYQVLVDSYSVWYEIDLLRDTTSAAVITKLKRHFSVHGMPHTLISDNTRQYSSQRFKDFAEQWDFIHVTSSPKYPQSSHPLQPLAEGQVVRMQTIKGHNHMGTVKEVCKEPHSYIIESDGGTSRRNRRRILPVTKPPPRQVDPADFDRQYADAAAPDSPPHKPHTSRETQLTPQPTSGQQRPAVQSPTKVTPGNTLYVTRSGCVCRPNPKYEQ